MSTALAEALSFSPAPATCAAAPAPRAHDERRSTTRRQVLLAVLLLTGLNFFLAYWRGTHSFNFSDSGYLLENLHRMRDGLVPYRDFFLSLPPAHHYACAAVWWLFGDQAYFLVVYASRPARIGLLALLPGLSAVGRSAVGEPCRRIAG